MDYHRAHSLEEALSLLKAGVPLAGGTSLIPRRRGLTSVVDLQDAGLDDIEMSQAGVIAGACVTLQSLADDGASIPPALARACRLEAGWNLRNLATLGGTLMASDGRSPLVTCLLALGATVLIEPKGESVELNALLDRRENQQIEGLITQVTIPSTRRLAYEQVARSPADRPIVCVAVADPTARGDPPQMRVALGGFGTKPLLVPAGEGGADEWGRRASKTFAGAGDAWASADYRSDVAGVLVRRLVGQAATP
jgi:CO/xanthine dehydrogenase FAD-binding subunit